MATATLPREAKIEKVAELERLVVEKKARQARSYVPSPKQELIHRSTARVRGAFTGNRFGKSDMLVREALMWATGRNPYRPIPEPPNAIRFYVDGYDGPHMQDVILPKFAKYADPRNLGGSFEDKYKRGAREIPFTNGSTIKFLSYNLHDTTKSTQVYGGAEVDLHIFDEHGHVSVYREAGARFGPGVNPEILVGYTPLLGRAAWEYDEIWMRWVNGEPGYDCIEGSIWDNPYLDPVKVKEYIESLPPEERQIRELGVWVQVGGLVYPMFDRDVHFVKFDAERVAASTKSLMIDPHPSRTKGHHLLWCGVDQNNRPFCYREMNYKVPIPEIVALARAECKRDLSLKEDINLFWIDCHWGWVENESGKSIAQQYQEAGFPVQPASNDKTGGIQLLQTALQPAPTTRRAMFTVMDTCPETARQFEKYSWKPQTDAMRESDAWKTIDEYDDYVTLCRYYVQTDPRYFGQDYTGGTEMAYRAAQRLQAERAARGI